MHRLARFASAAALFAPVVILAALLGPSGCIAPARSDPANYAASLARVLVHEGGWNHCDKRDPGGCTLNGITQDRYDGFRRDRGLPLQALSAAMERAPEWADPAKGERAAIYRAYYAMPVKFDPTARGLDYVVFDFAVHSGPPRAGKALRCAVQTAYSIEDCMAISTTWTIDDRILAAAHAGDVKALIRKIDDYRLRWLRTLAVFPTYGNGWTRRVRNVDTNGQLMNAGARADSTAFAAVPGPGKAYEPGDQVVP